MSSDTEGRFAAAPDEAEELAVERLIRLADDGPEVPAGGAERVKDAIRPAWQAEVRARWRQRLLLWAGSLAAAACAVLAVSLALIPSRPAVDHPLAAAVLEVAVGEVELATPAGEQLRLTGGDRGRELAPGSRLRTNGDARAALRLAGGQSLRLDTGTSVLLESARVVELAGGGLYVDSGNGSEAGIAVRTDLGVATDIGTQFEVRRSDAALIVRVRLGTVALQRGEETFEIRQSTEVTVPEHATPESNGIDSYASQWGWVQLVAPPFEIEGRSVLEFLDWVSAETGLWISFSDPAVERLATTTMLHGSIEGLHPGQAPEVVLPGCGLEVTRREGTLLIGQANGSTR